MGIIGLGIDIVEQRRIRDVYERFGERFLRRILCGREITLCLTRANPVPCIAARFAAKEATYKALGPGYEDFIPFHDVEIEMEGRRPKLVMRGRAGAQADSLGVTRTLLTISHDAGVAVAVVILTDD